LVSIGPVPGWEHIGVLSKVPGEQLIMVPSQEGDCLSLVNIDHLIVEATIPLRKGGVPWNARTTPDGKFALVTNTEFTGHVDTCPTTSSTVSVVDLRKRVMTAEIPVGAGPVMLEMDALRNRAYVTNRVSDSLSVIDLASQSVVTTIPVGKAPFWVGLTPSADLLVVGNFEDASLSLIDPNTLEVKNTIPVGTPSEIPDPEYGAGDTMGFAITKAGIAYVANWRSNSVVAIDLKRAVKEGAGAILGSQHVVDQPFAIELQEEMGLMIVGSYQVQNSRLAILDLNTGSPGSHDKLTEIPADGSVMPEGRAAGANYWFNVPFETRVVGVKAGRSTDRLPPDIVAVIL
jgi:YVTN family beta-propeller protein